MASQVDPAACLAGVAGLMAGVGAAAAFAAVDHTMTALAASRGVAARAALGGGDCGHLVALLALGTWAIPGAMSVVAYLRRVSSGAKGRLSPRALHMPACESPEHASGH